MSFVEYVQRITPLEVERQLREYEAGEKRV